jgi:CheY-like chemotaxis protein
MSYKILTVDDSRMVRSIVAKTFTPFGCEIHEAANGTDGLAKAAEVIPDLIFLDITMPDMNGLAVLELLRQNAALAQTPVVMLTAESGSSSIQRADKLKVIGYVAKPFRPEQLLAHAGRVLRLQAAA